MNIRDPLYGDMQIDRNYEDIIHSGLFRRLMNVGMGSGKQWVFPSANFTRFEHCIGVYHLAETVSEKFRCYSAGGALRKAEEEFKYANIDFEEHMNALKLVALLHDIGHLPFSHVLEFALQFFGEKEVEIAGKKLSSGGLHEKLGYAYLTDASFREDVAARCDLGEESFFPDLDFNDSLNYLLKSTLGGEEVRESEHLYLKQLIDGFMDIDRIDHLSRDAFFTGVPVFTTDPETFISSYILLWDKAMGGYHLSIDMNALAYVIGMLVGRELLYEAVYTHPKVRGFEMMLSRVFYSIYKDDPGLLSRIALLNDHEFLIALKRELKEQKKEKEMKMLGDILKGNIYDVILEVRFHHIRDLLRENWEFKEKLSEEMGEQSYQKLLDGFIEEYSNWEKIREKEEKLMEALKKEGLSDGDVFIYRDHTSDDPRKYLKLHKIGDVWLYDSRTKSYDFLYKIPWTKDVVEQWKNRWCIRIYVRDGKKGKVVREAAKRELPWFEEILELIERHKPPYPEYTNI